VGIVQLEAAGGGTPVLPVALLIIGSNGNNDIQHPYTAEIFPLRVRARATGWVAACTKGGGLLAQVLGVMALVPSTATAALLIIPPAAIALLLIARFGLETRGRDLRELDPVRT
jgi:putative MFS transporter